MEEMSLHFRQELKRYADLLDESKTDEKQEEEAAAKAKEAEFVPFKEILKTRRKYNLQKFFDINESKDYIKMVNNTIPVENLYEVIDSCNYNETNYWCPVLLKVGDELLKIDKNRA